MIMLQIFIATIRMQKIYINLFKNILLVDDDEFVLVGLKKILNQQHNKPYQIYEADDGETAIELAKKINFDLLIIDNQMQPLSGPQTAQQIKNIRPNCLIILSSSDELNDEFLQKLTYIDFIIHKPFTLKCFNEQLQSKLDPSVKI
ncbi:CheY-like superfamily [Pseudocohnilembus persalinus]|uniref:CheY-like superfamily n=1 Tax=Pseudocohnilembus persalinus TaxID=266149 RepID=A0A0V0QQQ5_PSEPJ|nr:CheY-like superfamily [Pseudocohnilembus persalinus]|eukprot:KRX04540.1 CheY-like superfamily [Pseudocohnilembus persalinus]